MAGMLSSTLTGCGFDSRSGHTPRCFKKQRYLQGWLLVIPLGRLDPANLLLLLLLLKKELSCHLKGLQGKVEETGLRYHRSEELRRDSTGHLRTSSRPGRSGSVDRASA